MNDAQNNQEKKSLLKETGLFLLDILYNAVIIIVLVVLIRSFLISPFRVIGSSMVDTLHNKEFILIDKLSYLVGDVDRGDPIVFLPPATSKDAPKFEEKALVTDDGFTSLPLAELRADKKANYCQGELLSSFFFCQEKVKVGDLVYYAPLENAGSGNAQEADWNALETTTITKNDLKEGILKLPGEVGQTYLVRFYSSMGKEYFVKRVIGIPGDTVKIDGGRVYVKGPNDADFTQIEENFLNEENLNHTYVSQKHRQNEYTVPEGYYFVLGDNRNHSNDSRSWLEPITHEAFPFVPEANISGKVLVVLWPLFDLRLIASADF